jgi:peroxiredoxin
MMTSTSRVVQLALLAVMAFLLSVAPARAELGQAKPWIGIEIGDGERGVLIKGVRDKTPAADAGLKPGDQVLSIDGRAVKAPQDLINCVQEKGVGTQVILRVLRGDKELEVKLRLAPRPDEAQMLRDGLVGKPAPDFALAASEGPYPAKLADLKGQVVVIEFWATWCGPCRSTLSTLSGWQKKYGDKGLRVVGISTEDIGTIAPFAKKKKLAHTVASDGDAKVTGAYGVPAIPTLVIVDRQGVVRYAEVGAGDNLAAAEMTVLKLLAEK